MQELLSQGLTYDLLFAGSCLFAFGVWISSRNVSLSLAVAISALKVFLPIVYFAWYNDGTWILYDDVMYLERGRAILELEPNVFKSLFDPDIRELLESSAGGSHILYGWWNALGMSWFGDHYYSPVFLNIGLTFIAAHFFSKILKELAFPGEYVRSIFVFFLLHWDVLAWSSLMNLKDIMVMMQTILTFYPIILLLKRPRLLPFIGLILAVCSFWYIRYYLPVLIIGSTGFWVMLQWQSAKKWIVLPATVIALVLFFPWESATPERISFDETFYGIIRFLLTPQPWSLDDAYTFLLLPSILHWFLFLPSILGVIELWRDSRMSRMFIIYFLLLSFFYGIVPELQGPRHRVQIFFIFLWFQFHVLWHLYRALAPRSYSIRRPPIPATSR